MSRAKARNYAPIKLNSAFIFFLPVLFIIVLAAVTLAQETVPAPYAGMKNPLKWDDAAAQSAGKSVFNKNCLNCHGAGGNEVEGVDFTSPDAHKKIENNPDFAFFRVSEGFQAKEMPIFKYQLSEIQRWQVITYVWSFGAPAPATPGAPPATPGTPAATPGTPAATPGTPAAGGVTPPSVVVAPPTLRLTVPGQGQAGQPITISTLLQDPDGKPISDAPVSFSLNITFLIGKGLAEIGQVVTDENGTATITYTPHLAGYIPVVARYQTGSGKFITAVSTVKLESEPAQSYRNFVPDTQVGVPYTGFPPELVLFSKSVWQSRVSNTAPPDVLRIPGGLPFYFFVSYLGVVILVWATYIRIMYQAFRISTAGKVKHPDVGLVPQAGMVIMALLAVLLVWILITPPYFVAW